jgi:hypothetical protein
MPNRKTRFFFGAGTTMPVDRATDLMNYLPQNKRHHYRDGYSMAESAKCSAHFEYPIVVWGGGTSMTDIMAFTPAAPVALEAKARESFDEEVRTWVYKEEEKNPRSPPHRLRVVDRYAKDLGVCADALMEVRYQLLHRSLAAALVALERGCKSGWMIVHSFAPLECEEHARNRADFDRYVALVGPTTIFRNIPVRLAWVDEDA